MSEREPTGIDVPPTLDVDPALWKRAIDAMDGERGNPRFKLTYCTQASVWRFEAVYPHGVTKHGSHADINVAIRRAMGFYAESSPSPRWRTMATAPKDGTWILAYCEGRVEMARWQELQGGNGKQWGGGKWWYADDHLPTHWMPMPDAPAGWSRR